MVKGRHILGDCPLSVNCAHSPHRNDGRFDPPIIEVVVAMVSSAVLLDEPFGIREIVGAVLIVGASLVEFVGANGRRTGNASGT